MAVFLRVPGGLVRMLLGRWPHDFGGAGVNSIPSRTLQVLFDQARELKGGQCDDS